MNSTMKPLSCTKTTLFNKKARGEAFMMNKQKLKSLIVFMFSFQMILACGKKVMDFSQALQWKKILK